MFHKLLIANRGEIACRIARTAHRLGVTVAAVYSQADASARHIRLADEAWPIGPAPAGQSYLDPKAIVAAARRCGADAIHPGYGFLSESTSLAAACEAAGIAFVGPPREAIAAMGDKAEAKARMRRAGVPVLAGVGPSRGSLKSLERHATDIGFPLVVKPVGGGGGKGIEIVREACALSEALESARRVAVSAFGDGRLLLERYLPSARHVEVQILADAHGRVLHVLDRDCSVQRRHQKLIEEAPAPGLGGPLRVEMAQAACRAAREVAYVGAGTVEFLLDGAKFFFLEMNTRLQVEHAVTEAVTGIDLVEWQLRIAAGEPLVLEQTDIAASGHAIEARVCAEDPTRDFLPAAGELRLAGWPRENRGLRVDHGYETGDRVPAEYDSLLGKLIAHAPSRSEALERLIAALRKTYLAGMPVNVEWLADVIDSPPMRTASVDTGFLERFGATMPPRKADAALAGFAGAGAAFSLLRRDSSSSPWNLADGFRLFGTEPILVRLRGTGGVFSLEIRVEDRSRVRVEGLSGQMDGTFECDDGQEALFELRPSNGGPPARVLIELDRVDVWRGGRHAQFRLEGPDRTHALLESPAGSLTAALPGVVVAVSVSPGDRISSGQILLVIEAMKMEHAIRSPGTGVVEAVHVRVGDRVTEGHTLVTMAAAAGEGNS